MSKLYVKILGTGAYLPPSSISSKALEKQLGYSSGTIEKASGVQNRHFVTSETVSEMGAEAAKMALQNAQIDSSEIDAVISVGGVPQQAIPSTATFIHKLLGLKRGIAFDINASCISFLMGLNIVANLIHKGVYRNVLLVSADIATIGVNPKEPKTASLFGDGAACCVLGPSKKEGIIASSFETKSELFDACECRAAGTRYAFKENIPLEELYFKMNGPRLFKAAVPAVIKLIDKLTSSLEKEVDLFIPHQASPLALDLLQKKLKLKDHQFVHIVRDYGNMIATSIPFALHKAIEEKRLKRGDRTLLFGTAAGLTIGGVLLDY
jgi:3-oxoacyl-[acyl-carrier-protein] synthase III